MELLQTIKEKYPHIPVIFISGYLTPEVVKKAGSLEYNADFVLDKPLNINELHHCVHYCIEQGGRKLARKILKQSKEIDKKYKEKAGEPQQQKKTRKRRLMEIKELIETRPRYWTYSLLEAKFNVSRRQVQYNIKELKEVYGFPIESSKSGFFMGHDEESV